MKIVRIVNGKSIELDLTSDELEAAYREQQRINEMLKLKEALDWIDTNSDKSIKIDEKTILENDTLCSQIIESYDETVYKNDMYQWVEAIVKTLH